MEVATKVEKTKQLEDAARLALTSCMGLKKGENLLVVTDEPLEEIGQAFYRVGREMGAEAVLALMPPRSGSGVEPPAPIAAAMKAADVVMIPTSKSLSHTQARKEACKSGARVASMPGITVEMMARTLVADYQKVAEVNERIAKVLTKGKKAHLTSPAGTDLVMSLEGRAGDPDSGLYLEKGIFGNLPAGEVYTAPLEGTSEGILVIDGAMSGVGIVDSPIRMKVEKGYAVSIEGGSSAKSLEKLIEIHGKEARNIAELGIGTNPEAILTGLVLEDEKVLGTAHVAIGNNATFGGVVNVPSHLDGILLNPTLEVDGTFILKGGQLVI
jgi:leucyl aminopeptidase (aminopeptidase T)